VRVEDGSTTLAFFALLTKVLKLSGNEGQHVGLLSDLIDRVKQAPRRWDRVGRTLLYIMLMRVRLESVPRCPIWGVEAHMTVSWGGC
jgi:hypothetical protein